MTKRLTSTLLAAIAVMVPGLASANNHDDKGFYIGAGAHLTGSELEFSPAFSDLTLNLTGVTGTGGGTEAAAAGVSADLVINGATTIAITADEDSDVGYGVHAGYKINKFFAVEVGYSILGEFSGKSSNVVADGDPFTAGASFNPDGSTLVLNYNVEAEAFSGALLGNYQLADNATVFGKLGYYSADTSEDVKFTLTKDANNTVAGKARVAGKDLLEDASGLMYGAGMEVKFGRNHNILVRGEFNLLADGLGEVDDITQFGLAVNWLF